MLLRLLEDIGNREISNAAQSENETRLDAPRYELSLSTVLVRV
jgi:hypothetical protein